MRELEKHIHNILYNIFQRRHVEHKPSARIWSFIFLHLELFGVLGISLALFGGDLFYVYFEPYT